MDGGFDPKAQLIQIYENLLTSVTEAAPRVLTGIVVVLLALLGAKLIERILRGLLSRIGFDKAVERVGMDKTLKRIGIEKDPSQFLPRVAYYLLLFLFGQAVAEALGLTAISGAISTFLGYLPNVVAALLVVIIGSLLGQYLGQFVTRAAREAGIDFASMLGSLVSATIVFISSIMAIGQLKIDTDIVRIVTVCSLAGLALAFGLSFGLGSRDVTKNIIAGFYAKKLFRPGDDVEVQGRRGTIREMSSVQIQLATDEETIAVPNASFMEQVVKR